MLVNYFARPDSSLGTATPEERPIQVPHPVSTENPAPNPGAEQREDRIVTHTTNVGVRGQRNIEPPNISKASRMEPKYLNFDESESSEDQVLEFVGCKQIFLNFKHTNQLPLRFLT